jgi:threonine synthase
MSTLKEPYSWKKKDVGYEIAEQLNWELPDVIIYPAGRGRFDRHLESIQRNEVNGWISGPCQE